MTLPAPVFSTVPAVRAELHRLMAQDVFTLTDDPDVYYSDPGRHIHDRFVALVVRGEDPVERAVRRMPLDLHAAVDEDYALDVVFWTLVKNRNDEDAQRQALEDVFASAQRLDRHLRTDQAAWTLGGLVTWCVLTRMTPEDYALTEGRAFQLTVRLEIKAARI